MIPWFRGFLINCLTRPNFNGTLMHFHLKPNILWYYNLSCYWAQKAADNQRLFYLQYTFDRHTTRLKPEAISRPCQYLCISHTIYSVTLLFDVSLNDGGGDFVPQSEGTGPISRTSSPPRIRSACVNQQRSHFFPFSLAPHTYLFAREVFGAVTVNRRPFSSINVLRVNRGVPIR